MALLYNSYLLFGNCHEYKYMYTYCNGIQIASCVSIKFFTELPIVSNDSFATLRFCNLFWVVIMLRVTIPSLQFH